MKPVAVVTGASRGIGAAVLERLLSSGYRCLVIGQRQPPVHADICFSAHDLSQRGEVEAAADEIRHLLSQTEEHPGQTVLINNAGGATPVPFEEMDTGQLDLDVTLNLVAPMLLSAAVLPSMKGARKGSIVNVASTAARAGVPFLAGYSAAKAGILAYTQSLAAEVAPHGIRVNSVCPGAVETDMATAGRVTLSRLNNLPPNAYEDRLATATGLSRLLTTHEVAEVICWLALNAPICVTGQSLNVCGIMEMS